MDIVLTTSKVLVKLLSWVGRQVGQQALAPGWFHETEGLLSYLLPLALPIPNGANGAIARLAGVAMSMTKS